MRCPKDTLLFSCKFVDGRNSFAKQNWLSFETAANNSVDAGYPHQLSLFSLQDVEPHTLRFKMVLT
jgi:hypothetical protein